MKANAVRARRGIVSCMDLARILGLNDESRQRRTEAVVEAVRRAVEEEAPNEAYLNSITSHVYSPTDGEVILSDPGLYLEHPQGVRDVRADVLKSPKAKVSEKTGARYLSVPMRDGFRTASSNGKPWFTKGTQGVRGIEKARAKLPEIVASSRRGDA